VSAILVLDDDGDFLGRSDIVIWVDLEGGWVSFKELLKFAG
jgi:hypothetical protein